MYRVKLVVMSCVAAMLWFAAQPMERVWCHTDVALTYAIPMLTLIGIVLIQIKNQRFTLSRLDIVLITWFLYVMGRACFDASYPCATFCLRTMQMMMLYVALRLLFTSLPLREEYLVFAMVLYGLWEAWLGFGQFIHGNSRHYLYLLTGSFLNPGPYSAILAMGLVMALVSRKKMMDRNLNSSFFTFFFTLSSHRIFCHHFARDMEPCGITRHCYLRGHYLLEGMEALAVECDCIGHRGRLRAVFHQSRVC